jgi:hypothetical protein
MAAEDQGVGEVSGRGVRGQPGTRVEVSVSYRTDRKHLPASRHASSRDDVGHAVLRVPGRNRRFEVAAVNDSS